MSVFGGDSSWRQDTPGAYMLDVVRAAGSFGDSFAKGFSQASSQKQQGQQFDAKMAEEKRQFDAMNPALPAGEAAPQPAWLQQSNEMMNGASSAPAAPTAQTSTWNNPTQALSSIFGAKDMSAANEVVQQIATEKPDWFANRTFNDIFKKGLDSVATRDRIRISSETAANRSVGSQILVKDAADFNKRVGTIDPASRAAIIGMSKNPDGTIAPMQWKALSAAEEAAALQKENARKMAEIEALERGDQQRTVISPTGVTKTFTPTKPEEVAGGEPLTKTLPSGQTLAWMPNSKALHIINPKGEKENATAYQATQLAKFLNETGDPEYTNFVNMAKEMFKSSFRAPTNAPAKTEAKFTKGQRAVQNGVTYEFDGTNWNPVK